MNHLRLIRLMAFTLASLAAPTALSAPGGWWDDGWQCRVPLHIGGQPSNQTAWVAQARFMIPEGCRPDGADVRVVDATGRPCRMKLMYFEPALYGVVAFELGPGVTDYWIYLGNPNPPPPEAALAGWEPRAGVFLETRRISDGSSANNWQDYQHLRQRSTYSFGAGYMPKIHDGFNPFGEADGYLSFYTAWFKAPTAGRYTFATASDDASFLWIDERMVCQWPGRHEVHGGVRGQHSGEIELTAGPHKLRYYHVDFGDSQTTLAAWTPPGQRVPRLMYPENFLPLFEAQVGALEIRSSQVAVDYSARQDQWLTIENETYTFYNFFNRSTARGAKIVEAIWTFSDGTTYRGDQIAKMFFAAGDYKLTLAVKDEFGNAAKTTRPFRVHAIDRVEAPTEEVLIKGFGDMAHTMPLTGLNERETRAAARLLQKSGYMQDAVKIYRDLLERGWTRRKSMDVHAVVDLAELMAVPLNQPREATEMLKAQLARLGAGDPRSADLYIKLGRIQLERLSDPEGALVSFKSAQLGGQSLAPEDQRELWIALGDAQRRLGKGDPASSAYRNAAKIPLPGERKDFDVSSFALTTEAYIRSGEWEEAQKSIDEWTRLYPTERAAGYATILQARVCAGRGDRARGIGELEAFLASQPAGVFAQMALEELGDLHRQAGAADKARECYQKVLEQFQDPQVQARVGQKLAETQ